MRGLLVAVLFGAFGLGGCGGSGSGGGGGNQPAVTTIAVTPKGQSLIQGKSLQIKAQVFPDLGGGVTWTLSGPGTLTQETFNSVTYTAPTDVSAPTYAVVTATSVATAGVSSYAPLTILPLGTFANVHPIAVDGGPVSGQVYPNGAFTSVTVCAPNSLTCATIDGILVDTGTSGLRVLASALPSLPALTDLKGNAVSECVQFPDLSYLWGQVGIADLRIGGEIARSISVHALGEPTTGVIPTDCSSNGAGVDADSQLMLGANGILGIGLEPQDCGAACDPNSGGTPPGAAYYTCSSGACSATFVPLLQQLSNPAVFFGTDNNGVSIQLPSALPGGTPMLSGSMTFGIGTQVNNALGDATIFTLDSNDNFTTEVVDTGQTLPSSFIDSGMSGNFFPDANIPACSASPYFCPASPSPVTATTTGTNSAQSTITFNVGNADNLFNNNPGDAVFPALAGPGPNVAATCPGESSGCSFEWGLPFFYGRNVFVAINGQKVPAPAPATPWWAYATGFSTH